MPAPSRPILHGYFRSSASFRVRIALNIKDIAYDQITYQLRRGEHRAPEYLRLNPQGLVPTLQIGDLFLTESLAIIEYLDEVFPQPSLLPSSPAERARVRALAQLIACDIHPVNNLRVLQYLRDPLGQSEERVRTWYNKWISDGFAALEARLSLERHSGTFLHGDTPTIADVALIPQVTNAANYQLDMSPYPTIERVFTAAMSLTAFAAAEPSNQPDAQVL
jgi:maleylacetoacetate isomerase